MKRLVLVFLFVILVPHTASASFVNDLRSLSTSARSLASNIRQTWTDLIGIGAERANEDEVASQTNTDMINRALVAEKVDTSPRETGDAAATIVKLVSPFRYADVKPILVRQSFNDVRKSYDPKRDSASFETTAESVLAETGLCTGAGTIAIRLKDCANTRPDEFVAVANYLREYFSWKDVEIRTITNLYSDMWDSPVLRDRIQARLMHSCLKNRLDDEHDSARSIESCRQATSWDLRELFAGVNDAACMEGTVTSGVQQSTFSYKTFVQNCVVSPSVAHDSPGVRLAVDLLPSTMLNVVVGKGGGVVTFAMKPAQLNGSLLYSTLLYRLIGDSERPGILHSDWFLSGSTAGYIPSVFAPTNFDPTLTSSQQFMSIRIPPAVILKIASLPSADRDFYLGMIARKVTLIHSMEVLQGAQMIADVAMSVLEFNDRELGSLGKAADSYITKQRDGYADILDMSLSTTLEDILRDAEQLFVAYQETANAHHEGVEVVRKQLTDRRMSRVMGE